jgi:hypothetical protein
MYAIANSSAFGCNPSNCVRARGAMTLFKFFPRAKSFDVVDTVDGQDAVEMVDFVLQEFGKIAVIAGAKFAALAFEILVSNRDLAVPLNLHEDRKEAEAGVPDNNRFFATSDDFGIHQRPRLLSGQLQKYDALAHAELGSGNAASVTSSRAPVRKCIGKVSHHRSSFGSAGILNPQSDFA